VDENKSTTITMHCVVCTKVEKLTLTRLDISDRKVYGLCDECQKRHKETMH